ncbi:hypothetical protein fugu_015704, partial [Takifugu bimaculatus]
SRTVHIPGAHTCTQAHKTSHTPPTLSETVKTGAHTPPFHGVPIQAAAALPKLLVLLSCHTLGAAAPEPTHLIWTQAFKGRDTNPRHLPASQTCQTLRPLLLPPRPPFLLPAPASRLTWTNGRQPGTKIDQY